MAKWVTWLAVGLGALAIGLAIVLGDNGWMVHPADDPLNNAIRVATPLFVVAVFLERALSVLNDLLFGQAAVEARSRLRVALLTADAGPAAATAQLDLDTIDDQKQRVRLGVGFVVATLISGAGVRTLAGLVTIVPAVAAGSKVGNQQALLDTMDVILTAGLLAGGSNGIAIIIDLLRARIDHRNTLLISTDAVATQRLARAGLLSLRPVVSAPES
jgi:hypothetical protein